MRRGAGNGQVLNHPKGSNLWLLVVRPTAVRRKPVKEFGAGFRIDLLSYSLITDAMVEDANMRERFTKLFAKAIRARGSSAATRTGNTIWKELEEYRQRYGLGLC